MRPTQLWQACRLFYNALSFRSLDQRGNFIQSYPVRFTAAFQLAVFVFSPFTRTSSVMAMLGSDICHLL
jgi:hypothetical protein